MNDIHDAVREFLETPPTDGRLGEGRTNRAYLLIRDLDAALTVSENLHANAVANGTYLEGERNEARGQRDAAREASEDWRVIVSVFPKFDLTWEKEVQDRWFASFAALQKRARELADRTSGEQR